MDVVALLVALLGRCLIKGTPSVALAATLALRNLARFPGNRNAIARTGAMPLVDLLRPSVRMTSMWRDKDVAQAAAELLHILTDCTENRMAMVGAGAVNHLLALLELGCGDAIIKMEVATLLQKLAGAIHESATEAL